MSAVRARLVSPGSVLAELDDENYQQGRVALLAKLYLALGGFFFVAANIHRVVFVTSLKTSLTTSGVYLCVLTVQALVWLFAKKRAVRASLLDAALVLVSLAGHAYQATFVSHYRVDLLAILVAYCVLMSRAVIVPSTPRSTLIIGALGVLPALALAVWDGGRRGALGETVSFSAIWLLANVALTTFTSHVIYGLREKANVGRYLIEKKIGEGGMGEVYLAKHTTLRRPTALKLLPPERAGEMTIERFEREVRETSRLSHPNTVAIYDYGRTRDGIFYYAMEYLDGLDLQRLVERDGPMPAERVVRIVSQIASALAEAHGAGLVHRDMKPANVMLCTRGGMSDTVKVLDFGLVKDLARGDVKQTAVNALVGTPHYLAPEAIANPKLVDGRTDLYAVGAIAYFLLVGEEPFPGESIATVCAAHLHRAPARPSLRVNMPAALEAVILSCLAKDPNERPQTAAELEKALRLCVLEAA